MKVQWISWAAAAVLAGGFVPAATPQEVIPVPAAPAADPAAKTDAAAKVPILLPPMSPAGPSGPATSPLPALIGTGICPPGAPCAANKSGEPPAPFTPLMLGDFVGPVANLFTNFKIAEGESPRPMDRVFFKYNWYNNINKDRWSDPTQPVHNVNLNLYTFGMEKTLFDGVASVGVRIPFDTIDAKGKDFHLAPDPATGALVPVAGGPGFDESEFGNLIAIAKVLLWDDRETGNCLSAGAVVSFPTASNQKLDPGLSTLLYLQPFTGFIWNSGDLFVQGFASMIFPIARPESIVSFTDLGVGYWVYKNDSRLLTGVAPTFEIHYTAPIRQADPNANIFNFIDNQHIFNTVDFTIGSTFEFAHRATLGTGLAVPVTGGKPFDAEILVQLNLFF
jgi:hypothetical protein